MSQISSQDKLKSTNKHFGNLCEHWKWDKLEGKIQVGPRGLGVKQVVNTTSLVGGGGKKPNWWPGAHWGGWKPPPKGGVWDWSAGAGGLPPLQLGLEGSGAHHKIHKNLEIMGT